jgi:ribokinase
MKPRVVVVGSYMQDLCWKCPEFPKPGETLVGGFATGPGGKGSNQAIACGRLGVPTLFVGAIGKDAFAEQARAFYKSEGVAARFAIKSRHATGNAAILVDSHGQNQIIIAPGSNLALARADVPLAAIRGARVVVTQLESNIATTSWALGEARRAGVTTILNTAPMRADFDHTMLRHVDIVVPNETEFAALVNLIPSTGVKNLTEARLAAMTPMELHVLCRALRVPAVVVTLGERGCFVSTAKESIHLPAHNVHVVDTTGAGDAFIGGLAAALACDSAIVDAARWANAVAALSVTKPGTAPSMSTTRELDAFLRKQKLPR